MAFYLVLEGTVQLLKPVRANDTNEHPLIHLLECISCHLPSHRLHTAPLREAGGQCYHLQLPPRPSLT